MQDIQLNVPLSFTQAAGIAGQSVSEKRRLSAVLLDEQNMDDIVISDEHKQIVLGRIEKYGNTPYLSWEDIERKMAERKRT